MVDEEIEAAEKVVAEDAAEPRVICLDRTEVFDRHLNTLDRHRADLHHCCGD
jgi:hypothetical protein